MKDILIYKDYIGKIHFSAEDEVFFGRIEGIDDLISFEGKSVEELKSALIEAVEDYIRTCNLNNKMPEKTYKGSFNIRISTDLHKKAARQAIMEGVSLNQFIEEAIATKVKVRDQA
ncbi:MAG: DNA repair protein [Peptococcaceae bacterium BRH_c4b]|nr:MAG: DNA repair protein [Peptococcaceae bacterium BRH_c4b]